jgi:hypothetical protein
MTPLMMRLPYLLRNRNFKVSIFVALMKELTPHAIELCDRLYATTQKDRKGLKGLSDKENVGKIYVKLTARSTPTTN